MSSNRKAWSHLLPWAALILAGFGWALEHQTGSNLSFSDCDANGPVMTGVIGLLSLILALAGALLSWRVWRNKAEGENRSFVALVCFMAACLLIVAILLQTAAAFILPDCFA